MRPLRRCIALHVNQAYRVLSCSGATSFSDPGRRGLLLGAIVSYCSQTDLPRSFRILESCCTNLHRTRESTGSQTLLWRTLYVTEDLSCRILTETLVVQTPRTRPVGDCARSTAQSRSSSLTAAELWRKNRTRGDNHDGNEKNRAELPRTRRRVTTAKIARKERVARVGAKAFSFGFLNER